MWVVTEEGKCIKAKLALCEDCKWLTQGKTRVHCGHPEANPKGNGGYVYPPAGWGCDIGKFEQK